MRAHDASATRRDVCRAGIGTALPRREVAMMAAIKGAAGVPLPRRGAVPSAAASLALCTRAISLARRRRSPPKMMACTAPRSSN